MALHVFATERGKKRGVDPEERKAQKRKRSRSLLRVGEPERLAPSPPGREKREERAELAHVHPCKKKEKGARLLRCRGRKRKIPLTLSMGREKKEGNLPL